MNAGDWLNAIALLIAGVFFGITTEAVARLVTSGGWLLPVIIMLPFIALFLLEDILSKFIDRIFPSGMRPSRGFQSKEKAPWARVLSFPVGIFIGAVLGRTGLGTELLQLLP